MAYRIETETGFSWLREGNGIEATPFIQAFKLEYNRDDEIERYLLRVIYDYLYSADVPVVEFYALDTGKFVAAHDIVSFLENPEGQDMMVSPDAVEAFVSWDDLLDLLDWVGDVRLDLEA
jgi:hypothetical protein